MQETESYETLNFEFTCEHGGGFHKASHYIHY